MFYAEYILFLDSMFLANNCFKRDYLYVSAHKEYQPTKRTSSLIGEESHEKAIPTTPRLRRTSKNELACQP
jgi:hypothetical protein